MAGTLVISTLSDGTNSTSATNAIQGSAKAWLNYNGATQTIRASFNVSSVTYNAAGDYTINFTNALPDANYSVAGWAAYLTGTNPGFVTQINSNTTQTTTQLNVKTYTSTAALVDFQKVCVSIFR